MIVAASVYCVIAKRWLTTSSRRVDAGARFGRVDTARRVLFRVTMSHDLSAHFAVSDARDVVWAHAVNSRSDLDEALRDTRVHMLEADLMLATAPRDDGAVEPAVPTASDVLMCHPPLRSSDLTFDGFAREVLAAVRRGRVLGIKLDFKEADAVAPCLELLRLSGLASDESPDDAVRAVPVWLNADVVRGPGGRDPIPAERFVRECARACPRATLSLGWTHTGTPVLGYTAVMAREMLQLIRNIPQHVTLAASAAHLFASAEGPRAALVEAAAPAPRPAADDADDASFPRSFTLWGPAPGAVRRWIRAELAPGRTYVDVKECTRAEWTVINLWAAFRPAYAPFGGRA